VELREEQREAVIKGRQRKETDYRKKFEVFESIVWRAVHYVLADSKFHVASFKKWG
jgi:hypothetical protein